MLIKEVDNLDWFHIVLLWLLELLLVVMDCMILLIKLYNQLKDECQYLCFDCLFILKI